MSAARTARRLSVLSGRTARRSASHCRSVGLPRERTARRAHIPQLSVSWVILSDSDCRRKMFPLLPPPLSEPRRWIWLWCLISFTVVFIHFANIIINTHLPAHLCTYSSSVRNQKTPVDRDRRHIIDGTGACRPVRITRCISAYPYHLPMKHVLES